jgi:hypothetical protein
MVIEGDMHRVLGIGQHVINMIEETKNPTEEEIVEKNITV